MLKERRPQRERKRGHHEIEDHTGKEKGELSQVSRAIKHVSLWAGHLELRTAQLKHSEHLLEAWIGK